jgi:chain length determinant protein (polysaccharide antigen chain regulator)
MQQSDQEIYPYQADEITLRALFDSLVARKFLIAGLTSFVTILAILYALILTPTYQATSSFTSPMESSIVSINKIGMTNESKDSVFSSFLTNLSSKDLQRELFVKNDFITKFSKDKSQINDIDRFINNIIKSVKVQSPNLTKKQIDLGFLTEVPYSVTMQGNNPEVISEYLNQLVKMASAETISNLINLNKLKISNRLEEISLEVDLLLKQAEKDRFSQIERIKEEDAEKIRDINDKIDRVRYQAKENRLNQIAVLTDYAKLAKSVGIIENNFKLIEADGVSSDLTIAIGENKDLPEWYLYGEKALLARVELLQNRKSDDPFITELVPLKNQLSEVQNNNLLKTFEMRQDDSAFIDEIAKLEVEKIKLESLKVDISGINVVQISQVALIPKNPIKPNKIKIILQAFIGSFIISILLALFMHALEPKQIQSI